MQSKMIRRLATPVCVLAFSLFIGSVPYMPATAADAAKPAVNTSAPASINSSEDLVQWMTYYYLHPQPDLLAPALLYADNSGLVDKGQAPLTAFVSRIFAQNPKRISGWVAQLQPLSNRSKPMLWSALWWSNTIEGKDALEQLMKGLNEKQAAEVLSQMAHPAVPIEQMEVKSPEVLDELWGAFSATGDEKYVNRLISVLPWANSTDTDFTKLTIGSDARWSLTSNAQQHPAVLKICIKARDTQPALRPILTKIIAEASKSLPTQQTGNAQPGPNL